jgi:hypothetical protein
MASEKARLRVALVAAGDALDHNDGRLCSKVNLPRPAVVLGVGALAIHLAVKSPIGC